MPGNKKIIDGIVLREPKIENLSLPANRWLFWRGFSNLWKKLKDDSIKYFDFGKWLFWVKKKLLELALFINKFIGKNKIFFEQLNYAKFNRLFANNIDKKYLWKNWYGVYEKYGLISLIIALSTVISLGSLLTIEMAFDLKDGVVQAAGDGMNNVRSGIDYLKTEDFDLAAVKFADANSNIKDIQAKIEKTGHSELFLSQSIAGDESKQLTDILDGLNSLTRGAKFMSLSLEEMKEIDNDKSFAGLFFGLILGEVNNEDLFAKLSRSSEYLSLSREELNLASTKLKNINLNLVPENYRQVLSDNMDDIPRYLGILQGLNTLLSDSGFFLGKNVPAKYLLLFQNTNEVRPTGGFIGSYAILTMKDGVMQDLKFDDVYNPDGQITQKITPPYPIWYMTDEWGMRDSNWDPSFPESAQQAVKMFEKGGGYSVDGVVAFTPEIVLKLLDLTGPVYLEKYDLELSADNFLSEVQTEVELNYDREENKPKQVLADLLPELLHRLGQLDGTKKDELWQAMLELFGKKDVLVYFYDQPVENMIQEVGWGGEVKQLDENTDYLYMVHANIGGRKSDEFMKESVNHQVNFESDGSIVVDLEIVRRNADDWSWPNYPNFDYLRIYVPKGSELLEVDGFVSPDSIVINEEKVIDYDSSKGESGLGTTKSYEEHGKQVWANWIVTDPYNASRVRYKYRLPFGYDDWVKQNYDLYVQKQPGRENIDYQLVVDAGDRKITNNTDLLNQNGDLVVKNNLAQDLNLNVEF